MAPEIYLIQQSDFGLYQEMAANIPKARLQAFILEAQDFDLKPCLGLAFFQDFMRNLGQAGDGSVTVTGMMPAAQPYADLYSGVTYTDQLGHRIDHPGLKRMLVYYTIARMAQWGNATFTATGLVKKTHDGSEPLTGKEQSVMVEENRSKGRAVEQEVKKYLRHMIAQFPFYFVNPQADAKRASGVRISGVDRSSFNLDQSAPGGLPDGWQYNS